MLDVGLLFVHLPLSDNLYLPKKTAPQLKLKKQRLGRILFAPRHLEACSVLGGVTSPMEVCAWKHLMESRGFS